MSQKQPIFSIIIPTYFRPKQLKSCICSITQLDYPRNQFEVIVVENGSKISLDAMIASFQDMLNITLIKQPQAGPAAARNTGAARARGKYLCFIDDDCTVAPDWLQALSNCFTTAKHLAVGGQVINTLSGNPYSTASQLLINYLYDYYNANSYQGRFFASNNLTMPKECFHAIDGFDATFPLAAGEDREFCDRWVHYGYKIAYVPEALVHHGHKLTFNTFLRQHFNYGWGAFHFRHICARRSRERIRVEPLSFYLNLLYYPISKKTDQRALLLVALLFVSQAANATGFFWKMLGQTINKVGWKRKS